ncbi:uncharacterized protein DS421_3g96050 [Arachis hypogaea]|nr:uncharacterized protein DS421_3g96050 [Arachis hypogaea]
MEYTDLICSQSLFAGGASSRFTSFVNYTFLSLSLVISHDYENLDDAAAAINDFYYHLHEFMTISLRIHRYMRRRSSRR